MSLQGYGWGIHSVCHKGHDAYVLILLKTAVLKACGIDSVLILTHQAARHAGTSAAG